MVTTTFRLLDRQGLLRGDLSLVQRAGLQWIMNQEIRDQVELERVRIESFALAANPVTSSEFLKALFEQHEQEDEEWATPQSKEEAQALLEEIGIFD